jgi:hypothetical protein
MVAVGYENTPEVVCNLVTEYGLAIGPVDQTKGKDQLVDGGLYTALSVPHHLQSHARTYIRTLHHRRIAHLPPDNLPLSNGYVL